MKLLRATALLMLVPALAVCAGETATASPAVSTDLDDLAQRLYSHYRAASSHNPDQWVRFGVIADRTAGWVRVWARPIRMEAGAPVEFLLIGPDSGHDYEALARSYAKAEDIHRALEFIGVRPGRPVDYRRYYLWPKGERVRVYYRWSDREADYFSGVFTNRVRAERLIRDTTRNDTLPLEDFLFVGSRWLKDPGMGGIRVYAADAYDPQAIISDYNEPLTVLDVPYRAVDGEVYGTRQINPRCRLPEDLLLDILLCPARTGEAARVVDLTVRVAAKGEAADPDDLIYRVEGTPQLRQSGDNHTLAGLWSVLARLDSEGRDVFLRIIPDDSVPVGVLGRLYVMLWGVTEKSRLRLDPAPEGHLFWKAFLPPARLLDPSRRVVQPWELYLGEERGVLTGTLRRREENEENEEGHAPCPPAAAEMKQYTVKNGEQAAAVIRAGPPPSDLLLVYCPDQLTYGRLMRFIRPLLADHPTVYVVPRAGANPAPSG